MSAISDLKITVLRRFHPDEVFEEYPVEKQDWMDRCGWFEDGQEIKVKHLEVPEGFCSGAWTAIYPHIRMLAFGGNMPGTEEGIAVGCCNDGLRPVIFKIERVQDEP
jgi:uncharacterized repeat protein (TIGR04076 family)